MVRPAFSRFSVVFLWFRFMFLVPPARGTEFMGDHDVNNRPVTVDPESGAVLKRYGAEKTFTGHTQWTGLSEHDSFYVEAFHLLHIQRHKHRCQSCGAHLPTVLRVDDATRTIWQEYRGPALNTCEGAHELRDVANLGEQLECINTCLKRIRLEHCDYDSLKNFVIRDGLVTLIDFDIAKMWDDTNVPWDDNVADNNDTNVPWNVSKVTKRSVQTVCTSSLNVPLFQEQLWQWALKLSQSDECRGIPEQDETAAAATCRFERDVYYGQVDNGTLEHSPLVHSAQECCRLCANEPNCAVATMHTTHMPTQRLCTRRACRLTVKRCYFNHKNALARGSRVALGAGVVSCVLVEGPRSSHPPSDSAAIGPAAE